MRNDTITLVTIQGHSNDKYGRQVVRESKEEIFCDVQSVRQTEFAEAGKLGITPAYCFEIFAEEYSGQSEVEYNGARYKIYRTYRNRKFPDSLELYAAERTGVK